MADSNASSVCAICGGPLDDYDLDRGTCHACRSPRGKIADLDIAIRASGDNPKRIRDWPVIRHLLRRRFGEDHSDMELWERCTDWLRAEGRLTPTDYLPLALNYLQQLLEHGLPRAESAGNEKLEALLAFQRELENWNNSNSPSESSYVVEGIPVEHPLHTAVVALQPFYRGAFPKPVQGHWRTFLGLARNDVQAAQYKADLLLEWVNGEVDKAEPADAASKTKTPTKTKRSTERGEGQAKLIAALTKHHQYADGSCLNLAFVNSNELARLADVSGSTASAFFKKQFGGHKKYQAMCSDATRLIAALKLLNQEFAPYLLYGAKPPGEDEYEDEE